MARIKQEAAQRRAEKNSARLIAKRVTEFAEKRRQVKAKARTKRRETLDPKDAITATGQEFADLCYDTRVTTYVVPDALDFGRVLDVFPSVMTRFVNKVHEFRPALMSDLRWHITAFKAEYKLTIGRQTVATLSFDQWSTPNVLKDTELRSQFGVRYRYENSNLAAFVQGMRETREKFGAFAFSWQSHVASVQHVSVLVLDAAPKIDGKVADAIEGVIIDINGVGLEEKSYRSLFPAIPKGNAVNDLLDFMVARVLEVVADAEAFAFWSVRWPEVPNLNFNDDDIRVVQNRDAAVSRAANIETFYPVDSFNDGICSIATLFLLWNIVCFQRVVLKSNGIVMVYSFLSRKNTYTKTVFYRSFLYRLLTTLEIGVAGVGKRALTYDSTSRQLRPME